MENILYYFQNAKEQVLLLTISIAHYTKKKALELLFIISAEWVLWSYHSKSFSLLKVTYCIVLPVLNFIENLPTACANTKIQQPTFQGQTN